MQKHKILAFLLALVVSIALWVYAVTFVNPDDTATISDIRVRVTGTSTLSARGLMISGGEEQYVDVEIAGRRSDLKELNSSNLEAIADVSNIDTVGTFEVSWTLNPPATVASGDIRLVGTNSNRVKVKISERRDRDIPVEIVYTEGEMLEGYLRGETVLDMQTISVSGPAEEVGKIEKALISVDLTKTNTTLNEKLPFIFVDANDEELTLSNYSTVSVETVGVSIQVLPYRDITLQAVYSAGGGLTKDDVTATISPSSIRVTGTLEALEKLDESYEIEIDLASIQGIDDVTLSRSVELPQGVTRWGENNTTNVPVEIAVEISDSIGLLRISLSQTRLRWSNGADGMEYVYADPDQVIELRGNSDKLRQLQSKLTAGETEIIVDIDVSQMDQTQMCPLTVRLPGGFGLGLFKEYSARIEERAAATTES